MEGCEQDFWCKLSMPQESARWRRVVSHLYICPQTAVVTSTVQHGSKQSRQSFSLWTRHFHHNRRHKFLANDTMTHKTFKILFEFLGLSNWGWKHISICRYDQDKQKMWDLDSEKIAKLCKRIAHNPSAKGQKRRKYPFNFFAPLTEWCFQLDHSYTLLLMMLAFTIWSRLTQSFPVSCSRTAHVTMQFHFNKSSVRSSEAVNHYLFLFFFCSASWFQ